MHGLRWHRLPSAQIPVAVSAVATTWVAQNSFCALFFSGSGGGFGAEDALEARASELDADESFAARLRRGNVNDAAVGGEVGFMAPGSVVRERDADLEVGANGDVEAGDESGATAAKIFAGSFLFEDDPVRIAAAHAQRQADGDSTFRALPR